MNTEEFKKVREEFYQLSLEIDRMIEEKEKELPDGIGLGFIYGERLKDIEFPTGKRIGFFFTINGSRHNINLIDKKTKNQ